MAKRSPQKHDTSQRSSAPYWGAVLAQAVRDGDARRQRTAEDNLRRLGIPLTVGPRLGGVAVV